MNYLIHILDALRQKGLELALLGIAVWYLTNENKEVRKEAIDCMRERLELLKEENAALKSVIEKNTAAILLIEKKISAPVQKKTGGGYDPSVYPYEKKR